MEALLLVQDDVFKDGVVIIRQRRIDVGLCFVATKKERLFIQFLHKVAGDALSGTENKVGV